MFSTLRGPFIIARVVLIIFIMLLIIAFLILGQNAGSELTEERRLTATATHLIALAATDAQATENVYNTATSQYLTAVAPTWTPTPTATFTPTDTATFTPTDTPTDTPTPTPTFTPTDTPTDTPTPTPTFTPTSTFTPTPRPTCTVTTLSTQVYAAPSSNAAVVESLEANDSVTLEADIRSGWYQVRLPSGVRGWLPPGTVNRNNDQCAGVETRSLAELLAELRSFGTEYNVLFDSPAFTASSGEWVLLDGTPLEAQSLPNDVGVLRVDAAGSDVVFHNTQADDFAFQYLLLGLTYIRTNRTDEANLGIQIMPESSPTIFEVRILPDCEVQLLSIDESGEENIITNTLPLRNNCGSNDEEYVELNLGDGAVSISVDGYPILESVTLVPLQGRSNRYQLSFVARSMIVELVNAAAVGR